MGHIIVGYKAERAACDARRFVKKMAQYVTATGRSKHEDVAEYPSLEMLRIQARGPAGDKTHLGLGQTG